MIKSGLFLCSIGLLVIVFSANQNTATYNWMNMIIGVTILFAGCICYYKGAKAEKAAKDKEVK
ncbi:DUF3188 domain-containing protein [Vagococcus salmoninarum]|uniref:DUF3188 domain-containing protein n=1 Tax=Vagococcus salmoninarum TaxID=2739 RepID=A0A429ZKE7_9ENTE|nr:DUF3188 domain-containing protein [Vagococcus salmoninarum]RST94187.1 hypothetical protein CBF35_10765 [Vagococcus salmoninarum]